MPTPDPSRPLTCIPLRPECRRFLGALADEALPLIRQRKDRAAAEAEAVVRRWGGGY